MCQLKSWITGTNGKTTTKSTQVMFMGFLEKYVQLLITQTAPFFEYKNRHTLYILLRGLLFYVR